MNGFLCIFHEFVEELVEDVLLVYVDRVGVDDHRRGGSSGSKTGIVQMVVVVVVGVEGFEGVGLGKEVGLIDGRNALCKGSEGRNVGIGIEGFALDGARKRVIARSWGVIEI